MRNIYFLFLLLVWHHMLVAQPADIRTGIGTLNPHPSSVLDVTSSDKGMLVPRMTTQQRNTILNPTPGLMIFNLDSHSIDFFTIHGWASIGASMTFERLLGGLETESFSGIQPTSDGGYILIATSFSSGSGSVSGNNHGPAGSCDYWIVKIDNSGTIQWNKLLGGDKAEIAVSIRQTSDGGFIVAGTSNSSANGDVSASNHGPLGSLDYWVVKLDQSGNVIWNKLLGGDSDEYLTGIFQTTDNGYVIAGYSYSSATGNITATNHGAGGTADCWILKIDNTGNIAWNKLLGGSLEDRPYCIQQTADGGYVVAGFSQSSATGDVTGTNHGSFDCWIIKLDGAGNISWNKLLGGNQPDIARSVLEVSGGGYIVGAATESSSNGDVTGNSHGGNDAWIIRLDPSGNVVWSQLTGGAQSEDIRSICQTNDGGYILLGNSTSSGTGDITDINHGSADYWVVKLNSNGGLVWNRLLGANSYEDASQIQLTADGGYIIGGTSQSSSNGDISQLNNGNLDCWIIKLNSAGKIIR